MPCKQIDFEKPKVCIGDRRHKIYLYDRAMSRDINAIDIKETLTGQATHYAAIKTPKGVAVFDSMNVERDVTHQFYIAYVSGVTQEKVVEHNGNYYDILRVINIGEENRILELQCVLRGVTSREAAKA
jgi:SPP1 family predicted phage head-tail adaptor